MPLDNSTSCPDHKDRYQLACDPFKARPAVCRLRAQELLDGPAMNREPKQMLVRPPGREFRLQLIGPVLNENGRLGERRARVHTNLWVSDFTPVHTTDGFVYTAFFVDVPCATERRLASFAGPANRPPGGLTSPLATARRPQVI